MTSNYRFIKAAQLISHADGLIIAAGAGMGVDSGLPDFRGNAGFWRHYPALKKTGIGFQDIASPEHFWDAPHLAWGFYGHRLNLYRQTPPHRGFQLLHEIAAKLPHNAFVYTSNVDGHFQRAGFDENQVHECHGSINHLQCIDACEQQIWSAQLFTPIVDEESCLLTNRPPACPVCGRVARPNVLMFNDVGWVSGRSDRQREQLDAWLQKVSRPVVIELGAGTAIPTVRIFAERQHRPLIRINTRDAHLTPSTHHVSLQMSTREALNAIHLALVEQDFF